MFWLATLVLLGLSSVLLVLVRISAHAAHDYDEQMPDIEEL